MEETMAEKLAEAARLMRERAEGDAFLLAVADWMDEERAELTNGDPYHLHGSALRAGEAYRAGA